jgi:hypothetical protein
MQKGNAGNSFEDAQRREDGGIGDADNVQKTTYVTGGGGTDPDRNQDQPLIARVPSGGGVNVGAWAVGAVALVIALVYAAGLFR